MAKLIFTNTGDEVELPDGSPISEACEEAGIPIACAEGVCGICVIQIKKGHKNLSEPTKKEEEFLGKGVLDERLACQCKILHGTVEIAP